MHIYNQALFYARLFNALLATPVANWHDFLILLSQYTYAEIEYYFFYFFVNISEAIIPYLPEFKTTLI
jgi:hypothetical protein